MFERIVGKAKSGIDSGRKALSEKFEERKREKEMYREKYAEEYKKRKADALRGAAVKRAKMDAAAVGRRYSAPSGFGGFEGFSVNPNPKMSGMNGMGITPNPKFNVEGFGNPWLPERRVHKKKKKTGYPKIIIVR